MRPFSGPAMSTRPGSSSFALKPPMGLDAVGKMAEGLTELKLAQRYDVEFPQLEDSVEKFQTSGLFLVILFATAR